VSVPAARRPVRRQLRRALFATGVALALALPVSAQAPAGAPKVSKACGAATTKATRERQTLDAARNQLARDAKARETCTTRSACARLDSSIATLQKRVKSHEMRVSNFDARREKACVKQDVNAAAPPR